MSILIGFLPWIIFGYIAGHNFQLAAEAGLLSSIVVSIPDIVNRKIKILLVGTFLFFFALIIMSMFPDAIRLESWTKPASTATLFFIALISIITKQPFTIQYAKETVPEERWNTPLFISTNYTITIAWTIGFALMTLSSIAEMNYIAYKNISEPWVFIGTMVLLIFFNKWYPNYAKQVYFKKHPEYK